MEKTEAMGMLCPNCRVDLVMSERHGVEIDYCPKCRGIWLDRGELDKIVERSAEEHRAAPTAPASFLPSVEGPQAPGTFACLGTEQTTSTAAATRRNPTTVIAKDAIGARAFSGACSIDRHEAINADRLPSMGFAAAAVFDGVNDPTGVERLDLSMG